ncbi:MAG: hypothetical protein ACOXZK_01400 [Bacteroidales bacterium]
MNFKKYFNSKSSLILIFIVLIVSFFQRDFARILTWDTMGQYCYLPNFFIDKTFKLPLAHYIELNSIYNFSDTLYQFNTHFNEIAFTKYTAGLAVLLTPFFLIGHLFAHILNFPIDGYSLPYAISFTVGCYFYIALAFVILRKLLKHFFDDKITSVVLLLIFFGTNLMYNSMYGTTFTHNISFMLVALLILKTIEFHKVPNLKNGIYIGVSLGLLGLTRMPNLMFGLIPLLWTTDEYPNIVRKINLFFKEHLKVTIATLLSFTLIISIQFVYWRLTAGQFFMNSYANNAGEGLDWLSPYTIPFLFSFKKGWIIYTPLAIIALIGFAKMLKEGKNNILLAVVFVLFTYIVSCWTTWWYAHSFSQRAMIDIYAIVAIALGYVLISKKIIKWVAVPIVLFVILNIFQTWQMKNYILSGSLMTKKFYFSTFGQTKQTTHEQKQLLELSAGDFINVPIENMKLEYKTSWNFDLNNEQINSEHIYSEGINVHIKEFYKPRKLFLLQAKWTYNAESYSGIDGLIPNAVTFYKNKSYTWTGVEPGNPHFELDTANNSFSMLYVVPNLRSKNDYIRFQIWRQGERDIELENIEIKLFEIISSI